MDIVSILRIDLLQLDMIQIPKATGSWGTNFSFTQICGKLPIPMPVDRCSVTAKAWQNICSESSRDDDYDWI